jgi:hypothetical protein
MSLNTDEEINNDGDPAATVLCDWCRCEMTSGDRMVKSDATGDAVFCTESCLWEALTQETDEPVKTIETTAPDDDNPLLECPHCHKRSYGTSDKWASETPFVIPGEDGFTFYIMTCPVCGKSTPMKEPEAKPKRQEFFPITSVSRGDIKAVYEQRGDLSPALDAAIEALSDEDMTEIAKSIGEAATGDGGNYWIAIDCTIESDFPELYQLRKTERRPAHKRPEITEEAL